MRRSLGVGLVVLFTLLLAACSGGREDEAAEPEATSTTAASEEVEVPEGGLSDEAYDSITDDFESNVDQAGGDLCELLAAPALTPEAAPTNPEQTQAAVQQVATYLQALADAEGVDRAAATTLDGLADQLVAAAEGAGYDPAFLSTPEAAELLQGQAFRDAMGVLYAQAEEQCGDTTTTVGG